jgi:hypothetical protein
LITFSAAADLWGEGDVSEGGGYGMIRGNHTEAPFNTFDYIKKGEPS